MIVVFDEPYSNGNILFCFDIILFFQQDLSFHPLCIENISAHVSYDSWRFSQTSHCKGSVLTIPPREHSECHARGHHQVTDNRETRFQISATHVIEIELLFLSSTLKHLFRTLKHTFQRWADLAEMSVYKGYAVCYYWHYVFISLGWFSCWRHQGCSRESSSQETCHAGRSAQLINTSIMYNLAWLSSSYIVFQPVVLKFYISKKKKKRWYMLHRIIGWPTCLGTFIIPVLLSSR